MDVIDQRQEDVARRPKIGHDLWVIAVLEINLNAGGIGPSGLFIPGPISIAIGKPARQGEVQTNSRGLSGLFDGAKHWLGKGFFKERQASNPNHQNLVALNPQVGANPGPRATALGLGPNISRVHPQGNDRQPGARPKRSAESISKIFTPGIEHFAHRVGDRGRGADQGVPVLDRGQHGTGNILSHRRWRDGVDETN